MIVAALLASTAMAQTPPAAPNRTNTDESKVGAYSLPDPLIKADGRKVVDAGDWAAARRPQLLSLFEQHQFGRTPPTTITPKVEVFEAAGPGLGGRAKRSQIRLIFGEGPDATVVRVLLYTPASATGPVPVLLHLGFSPNVLIVDEPGIEEGFGWDIKAKTRIPGHQARLLQGFDPAVFVERGYAVAHVYYGDIEPDFQGGDTLGVRRLFGPRPSPRPADDWGAIGAWSWGLSRIVDHLATNPAIDPSKIALSGASRLGKTVLWAAAQDQRFTLVMPLISGEGGAALSRRDYGETIADLTNPARYPYWFAPRYADYAGKADQMPVDSHMLLSLIAPRPLLLVNGDEDTWSDPRGEVLAAEAAKPVYSLMGKPENLGVVTHRGGHKVLPEDLVTMAGFMDRHFGNARLDARAKVRAENRNRPTAWWAQASQKSEGWYAGDEARQIAERILSWQDPQSGGWPLMNTTGEINRGDPAQAGPWGTRAALIKATVNEMRFLARAQAARPDPRYVPAIDRGLQFILSAQYPSGGWPHSWPVFANAYDHQATFNDDEMVDLMTLLREVGTAADFKVLPQARRSAALAAFDRGVDFILKSQIKVDGVRTAWCAQHDEVTYEPRAARAFEPVSISGGESAGVLLLLMSIDQPSPQVVEAIEAGVAWYRRSALQGIVVETTGGDRVVKQQPGAPPLWARFYEIGTNRPIFAGRDGVIRYRLTEVEQERRAGYGWYGAWGAPVLKRYDEWIHRRPPS